MGVSGFFGGSVFKVRSILLDWFLFDKNLPVVVAGLFLSGLSLIETVRFASVWHLTHMRQGFRCLCFCECGLRLASMISEGVDLCSYRASFVGGFSEKERVFTRADSGGRFSPGACVLGFFCLVSYVNSCLWSQSTFW